MKTLPLAALLVFGLASVSQAADPIEDQIKAFQITVSAAVEKRNQLLPQESRARADYGTYNTLAQLSLRWQNPSTQEFDQLVAQVAALAGNDPAILKAADELLASVKKEREIRAAKTRAEIQALLAQTGEACLAAKTAADLDDTLKLLAPYGRENYGQRSPDPESWQRAANAYRFVTRWQDYLFQLAQAGANARGNDRVQSLINELASMADPLLMPRSRILALPNVRLPAVSSPENSPAPALTPAPVADSGETATAIAEGVTQLDQLPAAIDKIRKLRVPAQNNQVIEDLLTAFNNLADDLIPIRAGEAVPIFSNENRRSGISSRLSPVTRTNLIRLRKAFVMEAAGVHLKASGLSPAPDDDLETYVNRVTAEAVRTGNWQLARTALEFYRGSFGYSASLTSPQWLVSDIEALGIYISALNQDAAGQYAQAISSYQRVLRSNGRHTPAQPIGARLAELKKTHPEAFEAARPPGVPSAENRAEMPGSTTATGSRPPAENRPRPATPPAPAEGPAA